MACSKHSSGNLKHILSTVRTILSQQWMGSSATDHHLSEARRAVQRLTTDRMCFPKSQNALRQCSASFAASPSSLPVLQNTVCRSQSSTHTKPSPMLKLYKMPSLKRYRIYTSTPSETSGQFTGRTESGWMANGGNFLQTGCRPTSKYVGCGPFFTAAGTGCRHRGLLLNGPSPHVFQQCRSVKSVKVEAGAQVSVEDIKQVLTQAADMKFDQGFTCFITRCLCLGHNKKKTKPTTDSDHLYINMTTGHFLCQHCSRRGSWQDLQDNISLLSSLTPRRRKAFQCFKDLDSVRVADQSSLQAEKLWESALPISACAADVLAQIQENFDIHELTASTLEAFGVRFEVAGNSLVFPVYSDDGQRMVGAHRMRCSIPEDNSNLRVVQASSLPRSGVLGVFGLNMLGKNVQEVVLTCNVWDTLAVYQDTKAAALTLPAGISALPQELLPLLERFTKLILWFGDDIRAWEAAKLFAKKLNDKRCCIIRPSVDDPGPQEALRRGVKLHTVLAKARLVKHKSIVTFAELRQEIFSQIIHAEQVAGVKWKRYSALNKLLKGHRRGELTVFTGPTGSGKTTFISDFSLDLCMQGVNTLWGSFEINNALLGKIMLTQFAQTNLTKRPEHFDELANRFEALPMYFMTFFGQESISKVIEAMSHAVYVHDIAHVIVDNLQFMMGSNGDWGDRFAKQDAFISAFRRFATSMNCHVTLVIHPRKEKDTEDLTTASVFGSAKATQEADNVLILQDRRLSSVRGRKYLQITKNRFDGELGVMLLKFDKETLSFALKDKPARRASREEATMEEGASENPPSKNIPSEATPSEDIPSEATPSEDVLSEDIPSEDIPHEDIPYEDTGSPKKDA